MKSTNAQNGDWYLSYDSFAAARCSRNPSRPPNPARNKYTLPSSDGAGAAVGGFTAGFTPGVLINIT